MNTWNGEKVFRELGLTTPHREEMMKHLGVAYRDNVKRAHLLVSKTLGKHIPQKPNIILRTAEKLAEHLEEQLIEHEVQNVTVIGYAETATALGAAVADKLGSPYLHSTRYPKTGVEYGGFSEEHSHAATHKIYLNNVNLLNTPETAIVLVDDELTTGNTIINTIDVLESQTHHEVYLVVTLTDLRSEEDIQRMEKYAADNNFTLIVISLLHSHIHIPENAVEKAAPHIQKIRETGKSTQLAQKTNTRKIKHLRSTITLKHLHAGVTHEEMEEEKNKIQKLYEEQKNELPTDNLLILGVEENMWHSLQLAKICEENGVETFYNSTTLSPVIPHNHPEYAIQNAIQYHIPGEKQKRYSYNIQNLHSNNVLLLVWSDEEKQQLTELYTALQQHYSNVIIIQVESE